MKIYRRLFLAFLVCLLVSPVTSLLVYADDTNQASNNSIKPGKSSRKKSKSVSAASRQRHKKDTPVIPVETELQKELDLSPSVSNLEFSPPNQLLNSTDQAESAGIFSPGKKQPRSLSLDGQLIMSPEPEADKKKSMDGAGISINLKR